MHLMNSAIFVAIFICALLSVPIIHIKAAMPQLKFLFNFASLFLISFFVVAIQYYISSSKQNNNSSPYRIASFLVRFPVFLSFSMGLSLHNSIAVMQGYSNKKTAFIRTPKFNLAKTSASKVINQYVQSGITLLLFAEGLLAIYFAYGIYLDFSLNDFGLFPFHFLLCGGFSAVFFFSVFQSFYIKQK